MTDFDEIDGVGDTLSERLEEDYDSMEELAGAHPDDIEEYNYVTEDTALRIVAQAGDLAEYNSEEGDEAEESEEEISPVDAIEEASEPDVEEEPVGEGETASPPDTEDIEFEFNDLQYDLVVTALVNDVATVYHSNPPRRESGEYLLEQMRSQEGGTVTFEGVDEGELNTLHAAVRQLRNQYQGDNIIEFMDELAEVEDAVNEAR